VIEGVKLRGLLARALWRRIMTVLIGVAAGGFAATASAAPAIGQGLLFGPIVQLIDVQEREDHADISIEFSCSARYVTNTPVSRGSSTTITLKLGPDCGMQNGLIPPELPLVGGGGNLVTGARVDAIVPGEITLELTFGKPLDFFMAPTASGLGLRVRLLNTNRKKGTSFVAEAEAAAGYSVNLDSSQTPIPRDRGSGRYQPSNPGVRVGNGYRRSALVPAAGGSVLQPRGGRAGAKSRPGNLPARLAGGER
jgi:hypothetical protein